MDNFEKYIKENKSKLDSYEPKDVFWDKVAPELETVKTNKPKNKFSSILRIAAILVVGVGIGWLLKNSVTTTPSQVASAQEQNVAVSELDEAQTYYTNLITEKLNKIQKNEDMTAEEKTDFLSFMDDLDEEHEMLKNELDNNGNSEKIIEAIIENYKTRIDLMEALINRLDNQKNEKQDDNKIYI